MQLFYIKNSVVSPKNQTRDGEKKENKCKKSSDILESEHVSKFTELHFIAFCLRFNKTKDTIFFKISHTVTIKCTLSTKRFGSAIFQSVQLSRAGVSFLSHVFVYIPSKCAVIFVKYFLILMDICLGTCCYPITKLLHIYLYL